MRSEEIEVACMARDQIRAMKPAGREMDAMIAERVMGMGPITPIKAGFATEEHGWVFCGDEPVQLPAYSTDIVAAMLVTEKFWSIAINRMYNGEYWDATVYDKGTDYHTASGDTAAEAICKAALLAVMEMGGDGQ